MSNVSSSNSQGVRVPKLRFPGFEGEWERGSFSEIFSFLSNNTLSRAELSDVGEIKNIHYGDVLIKFGDIIDANNTNIPYVGSKVVLKKNPDYLQTGDVVIADTAEDDTVGKAAEILNTNNIPVISGLHTIPCRPNYPFVPSYLGYYLNSKSFHEQLYPFMQGIKVTSISKTNIGKTQISYPESIEQSKIAELLNLISDRIEKQQQLVEALKSYKRGFFQRLLSRYQKSEYLIKDIVIEYNEKATIDGQYPILSSTMNGIKLQSSYFNKQAASENTLGYKIVPFGYFTYRSMSDTGVFHFNYQDIIDYGIISPAYPVFRLSESNNSRFVEYVLNESDFMKSQLLVAKEGGTRYALSFSKFQELKIELPNKSIQDQIANLIQLFEHKIKLEENVLQRLNNLKTTLLQQLFI